VTELHLDDIISKTEYRGSAYYGIRGAAPKGSAQSEHFKAGGRGGGGGGGQRLSGRGGRGGRGGAKPQAPKQRGAQAQRDSKRDKAKNAKAAEHDADQARLDAARTQRQGGDAGTNLAAGELGGGEEESVQLEARALLEVDNELVCHVVAHICADKQDEGGSVLVFLPGVAEITKLSDALRKHPRVAQSGCVVLQLHSSLSSAEQRKAFRPPPNGARKVILSTNIAETSITIEDCTHVLDCGLVKETRFDPARNMAMLLTCLISKANARQRRGRAGRVRQGTCWRMYSRPLLERAMADYQQPEMHRVPLEEVCLQIRLLSLGQPTRFLARALEPPPPAAVAGAIRTLCEIGAAVVTDKARQGGVELLAMELTPLGFHLASLPMHPRVGKLLLFGAIFGCLPPVLTIAAAMSDRSPFFSPQSARGAADRAKRALADESESDHLALIAAFDGWEAARGGYAPMVYDKETKREVRAEEKNGAAAQWAFCNRNFLSMQTLQSIEKSRSRYCSKLQAMGFVDGAAAAAAANNSGTGGGGRKGARYSAALLKALLVAGMYPQVARAYVKQVAGGRRPDAVVLGDLKGVESKIHPSSVNRGLKVPTQRATPLPLCNGCIDKVPCIAADVDMFPCVTAEGAARDGAGVL